MRRVVEIAIDLPDGASFAAALHDIADDYQWLQSDIAVGQVVHTESGIICDVQAISEVTDGAL